MTSNLLGKWVKYRGTVTQICGVYYSPNSGVNFLVVSDEGVFSTRHPGDCTLVPEPPRDPSGRL